MKVFNKITRLSFALLLTLMALAPLANVSAASTNLIGNGSVETADASGQPTGWNQDNWGTNSPTFTYKTNDGHTGTHSLYVNMANYSSGDAKWYYNHVAVKPNTKYTYTEFYKSNVTTELDIEYTNTSNGLSYTWLSNPAASATAWNQLTTTFTTPANVQSLTMLHVIYSNGWLQTDDASLVEGDGSTPTPTPPTVTMTAPSANSTVSGTQNVVATATDAVGVAGVQFKIDNNNIGAEDTTAPYSVSWDSKTVANGTHTLSATARNTSGLTTTSTISVNVQNTTATPTPPTVAMFSPANNSTVSGTQVVVSASANDAVGVAGVQFKLDNANLGAEVTVPAYSLVWDTTKVANGTHTLTAVARNTAGLTATAATYTVTVQNTVTPPVNTTNLISNPSFETANGSVPQNWLSSNWGTNTATFSYLTTGHTGGRSVRTDITAYTNGAANWYYTDVPVSSGKTYKYENWYQSNVDTEIDAEVTMTNGTVQYYWLGNVLANTNWTKTSTTFTVPAGAKSMAIYQILAKKGYLVTDDYSLGEYTAVPLNRGLVSVTFDDGWANQYANALPLLQKYGLNATFYIISGELTDQPDYMSGSQIKNLYNGGMEIGSHTVTHPDLTTLSQTALVTEMSQSQSTLQTLLGAPVTDFAYPYGAYNANTISVGKQYYKSQRTVNAGLNTKDNFDPTTLKIYEVDSNISQAQVQGWVNAAISQKAWLILVYHEVANTPIDPTDSLYTTKPTDLDAELSYIKNSGVTVETVNQALNEVTPQL